MHVGSEFLKYLSTIPRIIKIFKHNTRKNFPTDTQLEVLILSFDF